MRTWTFNVDGQYAIIYCNGEIVEKVGPWAADNPDGPAIWADGECKYRNEHQDWDAAPTQPATTNSSISD